MPSPPFRRAWRRHVEAELLDRGLLRVELADYLALVHDEDAVGKAHDLLQLQGDEQDGLAGVALRHELAVDVLNGADVKSARGLDRYDQRLVTVELTGDNGLLLVAAGHAARNGDRPLAGADVELVDEPLGIAADAGAVYEARVLELLFIEALEHHVLLKREVQNEAVLVPVLGDVAHVLAAGLYGGVGDVLSAEPYLAGLRLFQAGYAVDQLRLAVAVDACDTDYLARVDLEADAAHRVLLVYAGTDAQVLDLKHGLPRPGLLLLYLKLDRAADHHVGELLLIRVRGVDGAYALALAQDGDPVGDFHYLVELVGDEEDALALLGEAAHGVHELFYLLRREDCGRLVEDEYLVVAVEHL